VVEVSFVTNVVIHVASVLDQVSQGGNALSQETDNDISNEPFQGETDEE